MKRSPSGTSASSSSCPPKTSRYRVAGVLDEDVIQRRAAGLADMQTCSGSRVSSTSAAGERTEQPSSNSRAPFGAALQLKRQLALDPERFAPFGEQGLSCRVSRAAETGAANDV